MVWPSLRAVHSSLANSEIIQLIFSVFKTLTDQQVTVELKNDLSITGVLKSVDQLRLIVFFACCWV